METYQLYNGEVTLCFNPGRHTYYVNDKWVPGVTGAVGVIDRSAPLMWWAVNQSLAYLRGAIKPGVRYDEVALEHVFREAKTAHRRKSEESIKIGEVVHQWIEAKIKGRNSSLPFNEQARKGCQAFSRWARENRVQFVRSEAKIYSKKYHYAGTLDVEALVNGKLSIIDIKVSNGIYLGMQLQMAAYLQARTEESGNHYPGGRYIIRVDKQTGEPEAAHLAAGLETDFEAFLGALALYRRVREDRNGNGFNRRAREQTLDPQKSSLSPRSLALVTPNNSKVLAGPGNRRKNSQRQRQSPE